MNGYIWLVKTGNVHVFTNTVRNDREEAKRNAHKWIGRIPDNYIVIPLTTKDDRVHLDLTLQV